MRGYTQMVTIRLYSRVARPVHAGVYQYLGRIHPMCRSSPGECGGIPALRRYSRRYYKLAPYMRGYTGIRNVSRDFNRFTPHLRGYTPIDEVFVEQKAARPVPAGVYRPTTPTQCVR